MAPNFGAAWYTGEYMSSVAYLVIPVQRNAYKGISHSPVMVQFMVFKVMERSWMEAKLVVIPYACMLKDMLLSQYVVGDYL